MASGIFKAPWSWRTFVILACLLAGFFAGESRAENLLKNPGFETLDEEGFPMYWGRNPAYNGEWTPITDALFAYRGSVCLKMAKGAPAGHVGLAQGRFRIGAVRKLNVSVWAKGKGKLIVLCYLYSNKQVFLSSVGAQPLKVKSDKWRKYQAHISIPVQAGKPPREVTIFSLAFHVEGGPVYLDDAELYVKGAEPKGAEEASYFQPGRVPLITIPELAQPPRIDGSIDKDEWAGAASVTGFQVLGGGFSKRQTRVYAGFDEEKLYFAFICPHEGKFGMGSTGRDGKFESSSEAIEIWLQPPGKSWCQFLGMPAGAFIDQSDDDGQSWNGKWLFKSKVEDVGETVGGILTFGKKLWTAEVSIAFEDLGVQAPADGEVWRMNFCRDFSRPSGQDRAMQDWTSWSFIRPSFSAAEMFGYARFERRAPAVKITGLGDIESGNLMIKGTLTGVEKAAADVHLAVRTRDAKKKLILERREPVLAAAEGATAFAVSDTLSVSGTTDMSLMLAVQDLGRNQLLAQLEIPFTCMTSFRLEVIPVYVDGYVDVKIDASRVARLSERSSAEVEIPGTGLSEAAKLSRSKPAATLRIDVSRLKPGDYLIRGSLKDSAGNLLASSSEPLPVPERPEWLGNKIGVSEDVPPPWTPIELKGLSVFITQREYELGRNGLPSRIICLGKEILAGPATMNAVVDGRKVTWRFAPLKRTGKKDRKVTWEVAGSAGALSLKGELTVEFDGFSFFRFRIESQKPVKVDALWFEFPLSKDFALYARAVRGLPSFKGCFASLYGNTLPGAEEVDMGELGKWIYSPRWKWPSTFFNDLWVGDDERGFAVMCETDRNIKGDRYADFIPSGDAIKMKVNLVSKPMALGEPLTYEYAWQATPAGPAPANPKRWHASYFASWPDDYLKRLYIACQYHLTAHTSYPELYNSRQTAQILKAPHKFGVKVVPDAHPAGAAIETPEFKLYGAEWEAIPRGGWAGLRDTVRVTCYNSSHPDFMLYTVKKWVEDFNLDGIYIDSGTSPCKNPYHGCGYADEKGERRLTLPLWATRRFYKRLYTYLHTSGRDGVIFSHTMHETLISGFQDVVTEGEEWSVEKERQYRRLSPDMFRAKVMKNQYGTPFTWYVFHQYSWRGNAFGTPVPFNEILAMCLVHHVLPTVGDTVGGKQIVPIWDLMDEWWTSSEFIPYWSDASAVKTDKDLVLASAYLKSGEKKALVVVSNWNFEPAEVRVSFDRKRLKFDTRRMRIGDALSGQKLTGADNTIVLKLPARDLRILLLESAE